MKRDEPAFTQRKAALPPLTSQDLKVALAKTPHDRPQTIVSFLIPLPYDILCAQGVREWRSQRAATIEQSDVTTIRQDELMDPSFDRKDKTDRPDYFERLDRKLDEIQDYADRMDRELTELGIPEPAEPPVIEPYFGDDWRYRQIADVTPERGDGTPAPPSRLDATMFPAHTAETRRDGLERRAQKKIDRADKAVGRASGRRTSQTKAKSNRPQQPEERGRPDWAKVQSLMQGTD
jgi:hypothetical protein